MIDFQNASYSKLGQIDPTGVAGQIQPLMVPGEEILAAFKACEIASPSRTSGSWR